MKVWAEVPIESNMTKRHKREIRTVTATEFKNRSLALLREVYQLRQTVLITKRGKLVARLTPAGRAPGFIGRLKGKSRSSAT